MFIIETQMVARQSNGRFYRLWIGKDGKMTADCRKAKKFATWGNAAAWSVNQGIADTVTVVSNPGVAFKVITLQTLDRNDFRHSGEM